MNPNRGCQHPHRPGRGFAHAMAVLAVVLPLALGGCPFWLWPNPNPDTASVARGGKNAFCEREFAADPNLCAGLGDIVFLDLRAAEPEEGDTGNETGADEIPFQLNDRSQLSVHFALRDNRRHGAQLLDRAGRELIATIAGADAAGALVPPGRYTLRVRHAQKGRADAPRHVLFLTLSGETRKGTILVSSAEKSVLECPEGVIAPLAWNLTISDSPMGKIFAGWDIRGADLHHTDFSHCTFLGCLMDDANLSECDFTGATIGKIDVWDEMGGHKVYATSMARANLLSAVMVGVACDLTDGNQSAGSIEGANLEGADLTQATIAARFQTVSFKGANLTRARLRQPDGAPSMSAVFDGADLTEVDLAGQKLFASSIKNPTSFRGANLSGAEMPGSLVDLSGVDAQGCDLSHLASYGSIRVLDADLTNAKLDGLFLGNLSHLRQSRSLRGASMKGATFPAGWDLRALNLRGCDFTGAVFTQYVVPTKLDGADLTNAVFDEVDVSICTFHNAILRGASFRGAAGLDHHDFTGADLTGCDLTCCAITGSTFDDAVLDSVKIAPHSDLTGCSFRNARMTGVDLQGTKCDGVDFTGADVTGGNLAGATLIGAVLNQAGLRSANLSDAVALGAHLAYADLEEANLRGILLGTASPTDHPGPAVLDHAFMPNVNLQGADLRNVHMAGAHLYGRRATVQNAKMDGVDLAGCVASSTDFTNATMSGATLDYADLVNCKFVGASLAGARFHLAYLQGTDFTQAFLSGADFTGASFDIDPNTLCLDVHGQPIPNTWCYTGPDGQVYEVVVKTPKPPTSTPDMTCPDGAGGPCTTAERLKPIGPGPYPPKPECLPGENEWCPPPH